MQINYTSSWLEKYLDHRCHQLFSIGYRHPAHWDTRLRSCAGRFCCRQINIPSRNNWTFINVNSRSARGSRLYTTKRDFKHYHIDIDPKFIRRYPQTLPKVTGHELCHYYCFVKDLPYADGKPAFTSLLKIKHLPVSLSIADDPQAYLYYCPECHQITITRGRLRDKYVCSLCTHKHGRNRKYVIRFLGRVQLSGTYYRACDITKGFIRLGHRMLAEPERTQPQQLALF